MANKALQGTIDAIGKDALYLDKKIDAVIQGVQEDIAAVSSRIPNVTRFVKSPDVFVPNLSVVDVMPATPDSHTIYFVISEHKIFVGGTEIWTNTNEGSIVPLIGDVVLLPASKNSRIGIYHNGIIYDGPEFSTYGITYPYSGAYIGNGRVIIQPNGDNSPFLIYDTTLNQIIEGPIFKGVTNNTDSYFGSSDHSFVKVSDEKVICIPRASGRFSIYNPKTNTLAPGPLHSRWFRTSIGKSEYYYTGGFYNGILCGDKIIMATFQGGNKIGIYNTKDDTFSDGPEITQGSITAIKISDTKVYFVIPQNSTSVSVYNPATNSLSGNISHGTRFSNGIISHNNKVILLPTDNSKVVGIIDPATDTYSNGPALVHINNGTTYGINITAACVMGDKVLMFSSTINEPNGILPSMYIYDPVTNVIVKSIEIYSPTLSYYPDAILI